MRPGPVPALEVSVVVPWRAGCPHREAAWQWVRDRYETLGFEVIEGRCPDGPWIKAFAVADAIARSSHDLVLVADADVWCDGLLEAIERRDGAPVVIPHGNVHRLTEHGTRQFMSGDRWPQIEQEHRGMPGGGLVLIERSVWDRVPMDPRFVGWGNEDSSWGIALTTLTGKIRRFTAPLRHLWHPPQPRMSRRDGSPENAALEARYEAARNDPVAMEALVEEARWLLPPLTTSRSA